MKIAIHRASDKERLAAFRNAHEAWGGEMSLEAFMARRTASIRHQRAQWWVLSVEGEVVSALGLQPLSFRHEGEVVGGFGFGSVHTLSAWRRRGFADKLCRAAMADAREQGAGVGLLFSDIDPDYYGQMGFVSCPSEKHTCTDPSALAQSGDRATLRPIDAPHDVLDLLTEAYQAEFGQDRLCLWRDRPYSRYAIDKDLDDRFFAIHGEGEGPLGVMRAYIGDEVVFPIEIDLFDPDDDNLRAGVHRAFAALAVERAVPRYRCWITPPSSLQPLFETETRPKSITMVWADPSLGVEPAWLSEHFRVSATDYF